MNVFAAHHNTVIKVSAAADIFGGEIENSEEASFKGKAFFSGNLKETVGAGVVDVLCRAEI